MSAKAGKTPAAASLVDLLVGDLAPVRPVRLVRTIMMAIVVEAAVVLGCAWLLGARIVAVERLDDPVFAGLVLALAAGAAASAVAMTSLSIPGREVSASSRIALLGLPLVLA